MYVHTSALHVRPCAHWQDLDGAHLVEVVRSATVTGQSMNAGHTPQPINAGHTHLPTECGSTVDKSAELAGLVLEGGQVRYLEHRHLRYLYRPSVGKFVLLRGLDVGYAPSVLHEMNTGLRCDYHSIRSAYCSTCVILCVVMLSRVHCIYMYMYVVYTRAACYGVNSINVPVKPYHVLLVEEVLHPFFIFQLLSVAFWMADAYYYYSGTVHTLPTLPPSSLPPCCSSLSPLQLLSIALLLQLQYSSSQQCRWR